MILVPLITIELQLLDDCKTRGLNAVAGSQVNTWSFPPTPRRKFFLTDTETLFKPQKKVSVADFEDVMAQRHPRQPRWPCRDLQ